MGNKINIADILKGCPTNMELDCTIFDDVYFDYIDDVSDIINCYIQDSTKKIGISFSKYGCYSSISKSKCVIFPKGKTTWEGFVPPCMFKAGDVLISESGNKVLFSHIDSKNIVHYHCIIPTFGSFRIEENTSTGVGRYYECALANEQQRQKMYDKIKCSGHKYNQSINKLEKINLKFKVGDRIKNKNSGICDKVIKIFEDCYLVESCLGKQATIGFDIQDNWELVPNKFDISTLKPFDKVLVRLNNDNQWYATWFSHIDEKYESYGSHYVTVAGKSYTRMIPYKGNEHLLGKTDDCDEYYKTWK